MTTSRLRGRSGRGFDVVLDPVGTWGSSLAAVRPGGRLVVLGASRGERVALDIRAFYFGQFDLLGTTMGSPRDFAGLLRFLDGATCRRRSFREKRQPIWKCASTRVGDS